MMEGMGYSLYTEENNNCNEIIVTTANRSIKRIDQDSLEALVKTKFTREPPTPMGQSPPSRQCGLC